MMANGRQVHAPRRRLGGTDLFIMFAMAMTASAVGMAAHQYFAVELSESIVTGLSLFAATALVHALVLRRRPRPLPANDIERLTNEIARVKNASRGTSRVPPPMPTAEAVTAQATDAAANQNGAGRRVPAEPAMARPAPGRGLPNNVASEAAKAEPALPPASSAVRTPGVSDFWSVRPAAVRREPAGFAAGKDVALLNDMALMADPALRTGAPAAAEPSVVNEEAVRMLQAQIQRLAAKAEANEAHARQTLGQVRPGAASAPSMPSAKAKKAAAIQDRAIDKSIDALRATAEAMRQGGEYGPHMVGRQPPRLPSAGPAALAKQYAGQEGDPRQAPQPSPQQASGRPGAAARPGPPPVGSGHSRIAAMAAAISAGRFDVLLESILGLEDQHARHYEISVQLHGLTDQAYEGERGFAMLAGTGLFPLFDSARIAQAAEVALQLADKGKPGCVFSAFSGESLSDPRFLAHAVQAGRLRGGYLAKHLVMTFAQSHVRMFSGKEWAAVADLRTHGFRFALAALNDLDMDFDVLRDKGFEFVKLDAQMFLEGMPAGSGVIPAGDICRHLANLGITTIVERVDSADKHERLFGHGVEFGQGQLFGGARVLRGTSEAAA